MNTKIKLYKTLVLSILTYGCESWTLNADAQRRIQAFENKSYRRILNITYIDRITNEQINNMITQECGPQVPILQIIKQKIMKWFGKICRNEGLSKDILQGRVPGKRPKGRPRKQWTDGLKQWTGMTLYNLTRMADDV